MKLKMRLIAVTQQLHLAAMRAQLRSVIKQQRRIAALTKKREQKYLQCVESLTRIHMRLLNILSIKQTASEERIRLLNATENELLNALEDYKIVQTTIKVGE